MPNEHPGTGMIISNSHSQGKTVEPVPKRRELMQQLPLPTSISSQW